MGKEVTGMVGRRFGRWTVIRKTDERDSGGGIKYLCRCDCGTEKEVSGKGLRSKVSTSCGCYNRDVITKFGKSVYKEKLYGVWNSIKGRCTNPRDKAFPNYGGRGIGICVEWRKDYKAFRDWAMGHGYKSGLWIDRIDCNGPYSPENCRWATPKVQQRNKRNNVVVSIGGKEKSLSEWAEESGIKFATLRRRLKLGWSEEHLLDPVQEKYSHSEKIKMACRKNNNRIAPMEVPDEP